MLELRDEKSEVSTPATASDFGKFNRLSGELGEGGLDILYDLAAREQRTRNLLESNGLAPPTGAGPRARAILGRPRRASGAEPRGRPRRGGGSPREGAQTAA